MTLLPCETHRIGHGVRDGVPGRILQKHGTDCFRPGCLGFGSEGHHVVRRSHLGGAFDYVLIDGQTVINKVFLCQKHHQDVTEGRATFQFVAFQGEPPGWEWRDVFEVDITTGAQVVHDAMVSQDVHEPGRCPMCRRPLPKPRNPNIVARPRQTWSLKVPVDARENGVEIIEELLWACAQKYGRDEHRTWRYYTLIEALSEVVQGMPDAIQKP